MTHTDKQQLIGDMMSVAQRLSAFADAYYQQLPDGIETQIMQMAAFRVTVAIQNVMSVQPNEGVIE